MPIFLAGEKLVYFAHVPKCGGTSVEGSIQRCGVRIAMKDAQFWSRPNKWYKTSPQHIQLKHLKKIFPDDFFHISFAVVRNPASRFLSAFNHAQIAGRIAIDEEPLNFTRKIKKQKDYLAKEHDNHFVPSCHIVPQDAKVFRLEEGMDSLRAWLTTTFPGQFSGIKFQHNNKKPYIQNVSETPELLTILRDIYKEDYEAYYKI